MPISELDVELLCNERDEERDEESVEELPLRGISGGWFCEPKELDSVHLDRQMSNLQLQSQHTTHTRDICYLHWHRRLLYWLMSRGYRPCLVLMGWQSSRTCSQASWRTASMSQGHSIFIWTSPRHRANPTWLVAWRRAVLTTASQSNPWINKKSKIIMCKSIIKSTIIQQKILN